MCCGRFPQRSCIRTFEGAEDPRTRGCHSAAPFTGRAAAPTQGGCGVPGVPPWVLRPARPGDFGGATHRDPLRVSRRGAGAFAAVLVLSFLAVRLASAGDGAVAPEREALRQKGLFLESIYRSAPTGIGIARGRVLVSVNDYILALTGYDRAELVGQDARMLYPSDEDYDFVGTEKYRQLREHGLGRVETRWRRKDGTIRHVIVSSTALDPDDWSAGITFTVQDITDRILAEQALRVRSRWFVRVMAAALAVQLLVIALLASSIFWRRRAVRMLQESRATLSRVVDTVPQAVFWKDTDGRYLGCNQVFARTLGLSAPDDIVGTTDADLPWPPGKAESLADRDREVLATNRAQLHVCEPTRHDDGTVRWEDTSRVPLRDAHGKTFGILGVGEDITDRQRTEEALRKSEERFELTMQALNDGLWDWDLSSGVVYFDERYYTLSGYEPDEFPHRAEEFFSRLHPDDRERVETTVRGHFAGTIPAFDVEFRFRRRDGSYHWIRGRGRIIARNEKGEVLRILGTHTDITDRKRAEEELDRQSALRDLLMEIASTWLNLPLETVEEAIRGSLEHMGTFVQADRAYIFDYNFERQICINTYEWCAEGIAPQIDELQAVPLADIPDWVATHRQGKSMYVPDTLALPPGGVRAIIEPQGIKSLLAVPLMNGGLCLGFVGFDSVRAHHTYSDTEQRLLMVFGQMLVNIRLRQQAEEERGRLQGLLLQAQKMESVGRLAGGVAHDFNNMLSVILGHAELALLKHGSAQPIEADLHAVRKAAERSAELTRQLLAFARRQTIAPRVLDLNETVGGMLKMLRRLIGEEIELHWVPGADLWPVRMDPSQIDQILANLCVNARDAIAGTGRITIVTANAVLDDVFCADHPGATPGDHVVLRVEDSGAGMDRATLDRLFEPFYTTKPVGEGTGLGLSTVYGVVRQNEGFIDVASEPGKGSRFTIFLPRHRGAVPAAEPTAEAPPEGGHETILLVEDEPTILKLAATMLERQGYTVIPAGRPGEAIRVAQDHRGPIHLLVTDVIMPETNGRELAAHLAALFPGLRCLFMSGYTADLIARHGVLDEGIHFIQKPFSMSSLAAKIRETLSSR